MVASENGCFWSPQPHICLDATYLYEDNTVSVDQHIVITNDSIHEYLTWDTAYTAQRLADELSPFGFEIQAMFDDVCGKPYTEQGIHCALWQSKARRLRDRARSLHRRHLFQSAYGGRSRYSKFTVL